MATQVYVPTTTDRSLLLRRALQADAVVGAVSGAAIAVMSGSLGTILGIPSTILLVIGLILLPYGAWLWYQATRPVITHRFAWTVIGINALWVAESVVVLAMGWLPLTQAGFWFIVALAVAVAIFAEVQFLGLRRI